MDSSGLTAILPYLALQLTFGAVAGFASGFALKKVGQLLALLLGLLFISIQILAYYGFVSVDWPEVQSAIDPLLDPAALESGWQQLLAVLVGNAPFAGAFVPSLLLGLRRG